MNDTRRWYADHGNVVTLANYLADRGDSARQVAHAVEKPWHFEEEFRTAQAILDEAS